MNTLSLSKSSMILIASMAVAMLLRYTFQLSTGWLLEPDEYGILGISLAVLSISGLALGVAFPWAVTKAVSDGKGNEVFRSALMANLVLALIIGFLLYGGYALRIFGLGDGQYALLALIIVMCVLGAIANVYEGALKGLLLFKQLGYIRVLDQLIILGSVIFVVLGFGAIGAVFGFFLAFMVSTGLYMYFARRYRLTSSGRWLNGEVYRYAWPMLIGGASGYLLINLDILGIKFWAGEDANILAGYYQAVLVLSRLPLVFVLGAVLEAYFPFVARYSGDKDKVNEYVGKVSKYALIFSMPISLVLIFLPGEMLGLLFPQTYTAGARALSILTVGTFFLVFIFILSRTFQAINRPGVPAVVLTGAIALQLVLLYAFVPRYGINGAATATAIASLIGLLCLIWQYTRAYGHQVNIKLLMRIGIPSLVFVGMINFLPSPNELFVILNIASSSIVFLVALVAFRAIERQDVELVLSEVLPSDSKVKAKTLGLVKALGRYK